MTPVAGTVRGTVREYHADLGWGVIDAEGHPGGCWVHFSVIAGPPPKVLHAGQRVMLVSETAEQDGYQFRAVRVWPEGVPVDSVDAPTATQPSAAYSSTLTLTFDDPV